MAAPREISGDQVSGLFDNVFPKIWALAGVALLFMYIYGGFMWAFSGANPQNKARAQQTIFLATVGAILVLCSVFIVYLLITVLLGDGGDWWTWIKGIDLDSPG